MAADLEQLASLPVEPVGRERTPDDQVAIEAALLLGLDQPWRRVGADELVLQGEYALRQLDTLTDDETTEQLRAYYHGVLDGIAQEAKRRLRHPDAFRAGSRLDPAAVQRLKERVSVPEYARFALNLTLIGKGKRVHVALCPFHSEKTPSLRLTADHFYCFGACKRGGDVFELARLAGKLAPGQFTEAVLLVAKFAGLDVRPQAQRPFLRLPRNGVTP